MNKKNHVNIYLEDDLLEWVRKEAQRRRSSVSQVLRELALAAMKLDLGVK